MIIQDLAETSDGDLEQVKWNILLKYFIFYLENTETYYEGDKKIHLLCTECLQKETQIGKGCIWGRELTVGEGRGEVGILTFY